MALRQKASDQGYITDTRLALGTVAMEEGRNSEGEAVARQGVKEDQAQGDVDDELSAAGTLVRALLAQKKIADAQQVIATTIPASKSTNHIARLDFSTADASVRAASGKTAVFLTQSLHAPLSPDDQCISVTVIRITRVLGRTPCR